MTLDELTFDRSSYWERCESPLPTRSEPCSLYSLTEPDIQQSSALELPSADSEGKSLGSTGPEGKGGALSYVLERLLKKDVPGKEHLEQYLTYQASARLSA